MLIVGIDGSMVSTGICITKAGAVVACGQIASDKDDYTYVRMRSIARQITTMINQVVEDMEDIMVVTEEPGGNLKGYAGDLRTLFWFIIEEIMLARDHAISVYSMSPAGLKKFITGNGKATPKDKAFAIKNGWMCLLPFEYHVSDSTKPKGIMKFADMFDALALCKVGECILCNDDFSQHEIESTAKVKKIIGE